MVLPRGVPVGRNWRGLVKQAAAALRDGRSFGGPEHWTRRLPVGPFLAVGYPRKDIAEPIPAVSVKVSVGLEVLAMLDESLVLPLQVPILILQFLKLLLLLSLSLLLPLPESRGRPGIALALLVCLSRPLMYIDRDHNLLAVPRGDSQKRLALYHREVSYCTAGHGAEETRSPSRIFWSRRSTKRMARRERRRKWRTREDGAPTVLALVACSLQ